MKFLRIINILSIDVAAGTVAGSVFFSKICNVPILLLELLVLLISVWFIYTADHLLDAIKLKHNASSLRHQFHQLHFKLLFWLSGLAFTTLLVMIFFLSRQVLFAGGMLALATLFYFLLQHKLRALKEVFGATLYVSGVLLLPLSHYSGTLSFAIGIIIIQFAIVVLINLFLFAWYDKDADQRDKLNSFAVSFGEDITEKLVKCLFLFEGALLLTQWVWVPITKDASFILAGMTSLLFFLFLQRKYWRVNERYRFLGDVVFLFPIIYILTENAQRL